MFFRGNAHFSVLFTYMVHFENRDINWLNIHHAFFNFSLKVAWIFGPIYLYTIGYPLYQVFLMYAFMFLCRFPARMFIMRIIFQKGLVWVTKVGLLGIGISFGVLGLLEKYPFLLWVYIPFYACMSCWYWLAFHVLYAKLGEVEHRGRQTSIRTILNLVVGFVSPILNGWLIYKFGFWASFLVAGIGILISLVCLNRLQQDPRAEKVSWKVVWRRLSKTGMQLFFWGGFRTYAHNLVWQFVLFFLLKDTFSFGAFLGVIVLLQILIQLGLGHFIDKGKGRKLTHVGFGTELGTLVVKIIWGLTLPIIFVVEGVQSFTKLVRSSIELFIVYNDGKKSVHPLWYQFFSESAWDFGAAFSLVCCAMFVYGGGELRNAMYFAVVGILGGWWVSWRFFVRNQGK